MKVRFSFEEMMYWQGIVENTKRFVIFRVKDK